MISHKHITTIVSILTAIAVVLCLCSSVFYGRLFPESETSSGISMEYETELFNTDQIITLNILMDQDDWDNMLENASSEEYYECDVEVNGKTFHHVAIRPKGNTSLSSIANDPDTNRYSLKLEFDHYVEGQTCYGLDKLILNNNYADATNMKEALIYDMFQYLGADSSLYNYAKISVNGEYWGVYTALESVEDSFLQRNYGTENGSLYKPDSMDINNAMGEMKEGDNSDSSESGSSDQKGSDDSSKKSSDQAASSSNAEGNSEADSKTSASPSANGGSFPQNGQMSPPNGMTAPGGSTSQDASSSSGGTSSQNGQMSPPNGMTAPGGMTPPSESTAQNVSASSSSGTSSQNGQMSLPNGMTPPDGMTLPDGMTPPSGSTSQNGSSSSGGFPTPPNGMSPPSGFNGDFSGNFNEQTSDDKSSDTQNASGNSDDSSQSNNPTASDENTDNNTSDSSGESSSENSSEHSKPSGDFSGKGGFNMGGKGGFSMGGNGANLNYSDDKLSSYSTIWDSEITETGKNDHKRVIKALKNISEGTDLEDYMDIDNLLKYMAVHVFSVNDDSLSGMMAHNYYLYESDGKLNILPWDYNLSLGGMGSGSNSSSVINDAIDNAFSATTFFDTLMENEEYYNQYHELLQKLVDEYINGGGFDTFYNRVRSQIDSLVESDPNAFYSYEEYQEAADTLYQVVKLRGESIEKQLNGTIASTSSERSSSDELVDTTGIDLSTMGTMNMGGGGGKNSFGGFSRGEQSKSSSEDASGNTDSSPSTTDDTGGNDTASGNTDSTQSTTDDTGGNDTASGNTDSTQSTTDNAGGNEAVSVDTDSAQSTSGDASDNAAGGNAAVSNNANGGQSDSDSSASGNSDEPSNSGDSGDSDQKQSSRPSFDANGGNPFGNGSFSPDKGEKGSIPKNGSSSAGIQKSTLIEYGISFGSILIAFVITLLWKRRRSR